MEHTNTLLDREINNLISLKLKEVIDPIDKYGLIKHVKHSVDYPPNSDINDLKTIPITKVNLTRLIENIERENKELANALQIWV